MFEIQRLWKKRLEHAFNVIRIGRPFQQPTSGVVIGTVDGGIRVIDGEGKESIFETKGGCVQAIQFQDLTKFGGQDLIVGDSDGGITVFSNSEILSKRTLSSSVTVLVIDNDLGGNSSILAGDRNGVITALKPHELLWRVKLGEDPNCLREPSLGIPLDLSVRCLLPLKIIDKFGIVSRLLLVTTTNSNKLHLYNQGSRVLTVSAPSSITAVCTGTFTDGSSSRPSQSEGDKTQELGTGKRRKLDDTGRAEEKREEHEDDEEEEVIVGCEDGFLYLFNTLSLEFSRHAKVGFPPLKIQSYSLSSGTNTGSSRGRSGKERRIQHLVCSGPFSGLKVFHEGELVLEPKTSDWVHTFDVGDVDDDQRLEIVVGTLARELICYRIDFGRNEETDGNGNGKTMETR